MLSGCLFQAVASSIRSPVGDVRLLVSCHCDDHCLPRGKNRQTENVFSDGLRDGNQFALPRVFRVISARMLSRPFLTVVSDGSGSAVAERAPANDWTSAEIASLRLGAGSYVNSSLSMASDRAKTRSGRNSSGMMTHPLRSMVIESSSQVCSGESIWRLLERATTPCSALRTFGSLALHRSPVSSDPR
jgi:hypothetical protein